MTKRELPGLYIHIPFCLSKCGYCSFHSVTTTHLVEDAVNAITQEMDLYRDYFFHFDSVYIGGGTPSLLSIHQMESLFQAIHQNFEIARSAEITLEVNPGDVSLEYYRNLKNLGINRLNIGVQSFDDKILRFLERRHSAAEASSAFLTARKAGFRNIGMDLIYGIYGQSIKTWKKDILKALSFSPEHLSCYQLSLDPQTPLYRQYQHKGWSLPAEQEALDFFMTTSGTLTQAGYIHYEVSNFARTENLQSRHNTKYWRHVPYLGFGPAAHSFDGDCRWCNMTTIEAYLINIGEGKKPLEKSEILTRDQLALENLFLGLRTKDGINLDAHKTRYGSDLLAEKRPIINELIQQGLVDLKDGRLRPTLAGMAVADSLAMI